MNEKEKENFVQMLNTYKNVCISISEFTDFLTKDSLGYLMDMVEDKDILTQGLYGKFFGKTNCYVSPIVAYGFVRVSNLESPNSKDPRDWSPEFKIEDHAVKDIERLFSLKAFW